MLRTRGDYICLELRGGLHGGYRLECESRAEVRVCQAESHRGELFGFFAGSAATVRLASGGHLAVVFGSVSPGGRAPALASHNNGRRGGLLEQIISEGLRRA